MIIDRGENGKPDRQIRSASYFFLNYYFCLFFFLFFFFDFPQLFFLSTKSLLVADISPSSSGHPLSEIRIRALKTLLSKKKNSLVSIDELSSQTPLLVNLLEWFNRPVDPSVEIQVLELLQEFSKVLFSSLPSPSSQKKKKKNCFKLTKSNRTIRITIVIIIITVSKNNKLAGGKKKDREKRSNFGRHRCGRLLSRLQARSHSRSAAVQAHRLDSLLPAGNPQCRPGAGKGPASEAGSAAVRASGAKVHARGHAAPERSSKK